jgi:hypothetical protein
MSRCPLWALLIGFVLCIIAVHGITRHSPEKPGSSDVAKPVSLLVNRDFAYLVAILAVINRLEWFILTASTGVYIFSVYLFALIRTRKALQSESLRFPLKQLAMNGDSSKEKKSASEKG